MKFEFVFLEDSKYNRTIYKRTMTKYVEFPDDFIPEGFVVYNVKPLKKEVRRNEKNNEGTIERK